MGQRSGVRSWVRGVGPERRHLRTDALAALPQAISSVPDGMACGVLAGVSPVHGLYASFVGPIAGGLGTSTRLMVITTTSAAALAAGSGISAIDEADRAGALVLLTLLAGAFMIAAGILRLGRYTRFVSSSVMLGFLTGIAVNIVLGQLSDLTGARVSGAFNLAKAFDLALHPGRIDVPSLLVGLGALAILGALGRTRLAMLSALIALVVPTLAALVLGLDSVARVDDAGAIPSGFPLPQLPELHQLSFSVVTAAAAVAAIVLVQGAGVAESAPNPDGRSSANQDFVAQGAANVASGLFRGMPVGASVGQTALNVASGARTRWSAIISGVWILVVLVALSGVVGKVAMPTLAAILISAGARSIRAREIVTILRAGPNSQIAIVATFLATLFLPVAAAVGAGVVISLLLQLNQEAVDLAIVEIHRDEHGRLVERRPPARLPSRAVTVLDVYGSLFYAGSRTLQARLPDPTGSVQPAVVLRLRGRTTLGATFFSVVSGYARQLEAVDGRLYLTGLDPSLVDRLRRVSDHPLTGRARLYEADPVLGRSTQQALDDATTWLVTPDASTGGPGGEG